MSTSNSSATERKKYDAVQELRDIQADAKQRDAEETARYDELVKQAELNPSKTTPDELRKLKEERDIYHDEMVEVRAFYNDTKLMPLLPSMKERDDLEAQLIEAKVRGEAAKQKLEQRKAALGGEEGIAHRERYLAHMTKVVGLIKRKKAMLAGGKDDTIEDDIEAYSKEQRDIKARGEWPFNMESDETNGKPTE